MKRLAGLAGLAFAAVLAAPAAADDAWREYRYTDAGFIVQFPAPPTLAPGSYRTQAGQIAPARIYALRQDGLALTVTVADFSNIALGDLPAIDDARTALAQTGEIRLDEQAHIDLYFGRAFSVAGRDGSRSAVSVFLVGRRFYELVAQALPPDPDAHTAQTTRFQETLAFITPPATDAGPAPSP